MISGALVGLGWLFYLALLLVALFGVVITMGDMLAPVLASIVIAYLLEGVVGILERRSLPRLPGHRPGDR